MSRGASPSSSTVVATAGAVNAADYEKWTYDANDNVTLDRKRDGHEVRFTYDNLDRRQTRRYRNAGVDEPVAGWVFYDYDLRGLQESAAFGSIAGPGIANAFDNARRPISSTDTTGGASRTLGYLYDSASNRIRITHPDNPAVNYFTYDYDALSRVTAIRDSGATALVTIAYDDSGDRASLTRANGAATTYTYDPISRLATLFHDLAGTAQDVTLSFPALGGYNPASQIVSRNRTNDLYAYRPAATSNQAYAPNGLNQYDSVGGTPFDYDANGNLTSDGGSTFAYDVENRLLSASGARTATLSYDPGGRLYKTQGASAGSATRLLYDGDALVAEYDSAGTLLRRYVHGPGVDEPLVWYEGSLVTPAARRFLHTDHQGTIIGISDQGGGAVAINRFDPWGIAAAGNLGRFSYTGQIAIPELGMYHYKARIYSPALGRFLQTDPIGYDDQVNLYAYVANDPVNRRDPTGLDDVYNFPGLKIIYVPVVNMSDASDKEVLNNMRIDGVDSSGTRIEVRSYMGREIDSVSVRTDRSLKDTNPDGARRSHADSIGGREILLAPGAGSKTQKHEFGHTLRAGDQYRGGVDAKGQRVQRDVPGSRGTLMGHGNGTRPNQQTIDEISRGSSSSRNTQFICTAASSGHIDCHAK